MLPLFLSCPKRFTHSSSWMEIIKCRTSNVLYGMINAKCCIATTGMQPGRMNSYTIGKELRNKLIVRSFISQVTSISHGDDTPSSSSSDYRKLNNVAPLDTLDQSTIVKPQNPNHQSPCHRSDEDWERFHNNMMKKGALIDSDFVDIEQCIQWWVARSRAEVQKTIQVRTRNNRYKVRQQRSNQHFVNMSRKHRNLAAKSISSALELFGCFVKAFEFRMEMASTDDSYMIEQWKYWHGGRGPRSTQMLNSILDAWRLCWIDIGRENKYLPMPETIFELLKDKWSSVIPMNAHTYTVLMEAPVATMNLVCDKDPQYHVPIFCEKVLTFMLQQKEPMDASDPPPRFASEISALPGNAAYATVLNAWARSGSPDAALKAESLFHQFSTLCKDGTLRTTPNTICYNAVLATMTTPTKPIINRRADLLKNSSSDVYHELDVELVDDLLRRHQTLCRADELFQTMQKCPYPNLVPDIVSFRTMIFCWAEYSCDVRCIDREKSIQAMDRAVALLYEVARLHVDSANTSTEINTSFFSKVINLLVCNQPKIIDNYAKADLRRAEGIYHYMLNLYRETRDERFTPDEGLLCLMISVYAKDSRPLEADAILSRLENESKLTKQVALLPRTNYYYDTLKSCMKLATEDIQSGKYEYACIFADRAESILLRMIGIACSTKNVKYMPDQSTLNSMLELWISCRMPQRAERFFRDIEALFETTQYRGLRWKSNQFRRLVSAWAVECNDSTIYYAQQAENLLNEMRRRYEQTNDVELRPNVVTTTQVVAAWLRTQHPDLVVKCISLYNDSMAAYVAGNLEARPDVTLYGSILKAFSRVGDGQGAVEFLETMKNDYFNSGNESAKPNIGIFNMVLLSWLKSKDENAAIRALEVYDSMLSLNETMNLGLEPDYRTYSILSDVLKNSTLMEINEKKKYFMQQRDLLQPSP